MLVRCQNSGHYVGITLLTARMIASIEGIVQYTALLVDKEYVTSIVYNIKQANWQNIHRCGADCFGAKENFSLRSLTKFVSTLSLYCMERFRLDTMSQIRHNNDLISQACAVPLLSFA